MVLTFIGTGVWEETDISLKGLEELRDSDIIFAEQYTSETEEGTIERLEKLIGKSINVLTREEVEDGKSILAEAERKRVALVVAGDPMISTTHISLKLDALKRRIPVRIIHSSSILSAAISESGLHTYKFGRPTTLPFWSEKYKPTSTYDAIAENLSRGLHTMLFLDLKDGKRMTAHEAMNLLLEIEKEKKGKIITPKTKLLVLSRIGSEAQKLSYGEIGKLQKSKNLGSTPFILIIPGKLHFTEEEALLIN
jgi:diphthine synthase